MTTGPAISRGFNQSMRKAMILTVMLLAMIKFAEAQGETNSQNASITNIDDDIIQTLQYGTVYNNIQQQANSFNFYQFKIQKEGYVTQYTAIRLDAEDSTSDPDLYVSQSNPMPMTMEESDQYSVQTGSDFCILKKSLYIINSTVYFSVKCENDCIYSIKIMSTPLKQVYDGQRIPLRLESRWLTILVYQVPVTLSPGQIVDRYNLTVDTQSTFCSIQLYFSPNDDFTQIEEKDDDIVVNGGKSLRISSGDIGWCTNCFVYFIIKTDRPMLYQAVAKALTPRIVLNDTFTLNSHFIGFRNECIQYTVERSVNDVSIFMKTFQNDLDFTINARNTRTNQSSSTIIMKSNAYKSKNYIIRSQDRQAYGQGNGIMYICTYPLADTSASLWSSQYYSNGRFNLFEDTFTTFQLDSQDFIYFRFTSFALSQRQNLTLTLQSFNQGFQIPLILYTVCDYIQPTDCTLTQEQGTTVSSGGGTADDSNYLAVANGLTNYTSQTRTVVINHNPSDCPQKLSCTYLFSVYNPENSGPFKINLLLKLAQTDGPTPVQLFQTYQGTVGYQQYSYFKVQVTPSQVAIYNITKIVFQLQSYLGRGELYYSSTSDKPTRENCEAYSRAQYAKNQLAINVQGLNLLTSTLYIGVYGGTETQFGLTFNAEYSRKYPRVIDESQNVPLDPPSQNDDNGQQQNGGFSIDGAIQVFERQKVSFELLQATSHSDYYFDVQPGRAVVLYVSSSTEDSIFYYDVYSSTNSSWLNNNVGRLIVGPFETQTTLLISFTPQALQSSTTVNLMIYTGLSRAPGSVTELALNRSYEGFAYSEAQTVYFKKYLMDTNGTYQYNITTMIGKPLLLVESGNFKGFMDTSNDTTYDYAVMAQEDGYNVTFRLDNATRQKSNFFCRNASFPIRGGNDNCTMYIGVQCNDLCIFNLSVSLVAGQNRSFPEPILIQQSSSQIISGSVGGRNLTTYYYIPFIRGQLGDLTFLLNKLNNDSYIVGRIITNAYLPYFNWSYPNRTFFDFSVRTNRSNYEILEISNQTFQNRCLSNSSCALILGIVGNSPLNTTQSTFTLQILNQSQRFDPFTAKTGKLSNSSTYDYYWMVFNTSANTTMQANSTVAQLSQPPLNVKWQFMITASSKNALGVDDMQLFATVINGRVPTNASFDYSGDNSWWGGPSALSISSDHSIFQSQVLGSKMLIIIAVQALYDDTEYSLVNFGPQVQDQNFFRFNELIDGSWDNFTLINGTQPPSFKIYRLFNYGFKDFQLTFNCTDGGFQVLLNYKPFLGTQYDQESQMKPWLMTLPLFNETSLLQNFYVRNQTRTLTIRQSDEFSSGLWCQLCQYYIVVYQNSNRTSVCNMSIKSLPDAGMLNVPQIYPGQTWSQLVNENNTQIQRKFILDSRQLFEFNVSNPSNKTFTVFVGNHTDYLNNQIIWQQTGNSTVVLRVKQSDQSFQIGTYYYITVLAIDTPVRLTITFKQPPIYQYLKPNVIYMDKMWTANDYMDFYYLETPALTNYTAQVVVKSLKPGLYPVIYLYRNDFINTSYNISQLKMASVGFNTHKVENLMYQVPNQTVVAQFNVTAMNQTYFVPYPVYFNTTLKNKTNGKIYNVTNTTWSNWSYSNFNQTAFTMALYWSTLGLSHQTKAEFEITYTITPWSTTTLKQPLEQKEEQNDVWNQQIQELPESQYTYRQTLSNRIKQSSNTNHLKDDFKESYIESIE